MKHDTAWHDHPDSTPLLFSLTCKNNRKAYTYDYSGFEEEFLPIARAFAWSVLRRSHAVGHETRSAVSGAVRHLQKFVLNISLKYRPHQPSQITESLLREFAKWLKEKSGLSYRTAAGSFRVLVPFIRQWQGHPWAASGLAVPQFMFPRSNSSGSKGATKGYTSEELKTIAKHVIADIKESNEKLKASYVPQYSGKPPPLEDVAPESDKGNPSGAKWEVLEYRIWWWENECRCQCLTAKEIKKKPGAYAFLYGYWQRGVKKKTTKLGEEMLQAFYAQIGAGPRYEPRYLNKSPPIRYNTKWQKPEYIDWVWENECDCCALSMRDLKKEHNKLYVALREHHNGHSGLCKRLGIKTILTLDDLSPYYVGLLLSTALNPAVVQGLRVDCLVEDLLSTEKQSLAWTKLRANRAGLTIPASGKFQLAPANIVRDLIEVTAPFRSKNNPFLFATNGRPGAPYALHKKSFGISIERWFESHGLQRIDSSDDVLAMHAATNFRPAIAKAGYERTGSLQYVQSLLSHARAETTADYIGKLSDAHLVFHRGIHIEAIFVGAVNGRDAARKFVQEKNSSNSNGHIDGKPVQTMEAHCRDILNSPLHGQMRGRECTGQQACLYCANLVVTTSDIGRHFAMVRYYTHKLTAGEITVPEYQLLVEDRVLMFEAHILPKYDTELVGSLRADAERNPPPEYRIAK